MLDFPRWKVLTLWAVTILVSLASLPSLFSVSGLAWPSALPSPKINLGLDLAGGSHIQLEADPRKCASSGWTAWTNRFATSCGRPMPRSASATFPTAMAA
jgi:preprotein translocase subunit SecD